jgi:hypothetical protein
MERYVKGKSRFLVATTNGQPGYTVFRLDGHISNERLSPVYNKIRTRRGPEQIARRLARQGVSVANIKRHIPDPTGTRISKESTEEFPQHLTSAQVAKILNVSTDTAFRLFEGKAGVLDFGFSERRSKRIRRLLRIPPSAVRLVQAEFQSKMRK